MAVPTTGGPGRPRIPRSHISLIRRISSGNPGWGEDRISLELKAKLGVEHAPSTIRRYMVTREEDGRPVSSTWRAFLAGHDSCSKSFSSAESAGSGLKLRVPLGRL
jgi:hypothetical protein